MSVEKVISERGIEELLHFTTNSGLVGMFATGGIKPRKRLPEDKYLEHVYRPNASVRKDQQWLDYVNLSISRINTEYFQHSQGWHAKDDVWWCAVSVDPVVLTHDGVVFTTTNNIYSGVRRGVGVDGLEALFAPQITRWTGNVAERPIEHARCVPTCHQAEVLYPGILSVEHFRKIYVASGEHADIVGSQSEMLLKPETAGSNTMTIQIRNEVFGT